MRFKWFLWAGGGVLLVAGGMYLWISRAMGSDPFMPMFADNCAVCHGEHMEGSTQGPALIGRTLSYGDSVAELTRSIAGGFPNKGMPGAAEKRGNG